MKKSPPVPRPEGIFHPLSYIRKTNHFPDKSSVFPTLSEKSAFPRTSFSFLTHRFAEQVAVADSRGRHWLPKREGAHEVGRTASGYCRYNINISHPCNIRKTNHSPDESSVSPTLSAKPAFPWTNLQSSPFRVQSKLQWQIVEGGIGSRKGKGPTKWEGPPAAICHCNIPISPH